MKVYQAMAQKVQAIENCQLSGNLEWLERHNLDLKELVERLPSGSGINSGVEFDRARSTPEKLVFNFSYDHMDENGYYTEVTDHTLTVRGSLAFGCRLTIITISGRNRNDIKEYLYEIFDCALAEELVEEAIGA